MLVTATQTFFHSTGKVDAGTIHDDDTALVRRFASMFNPLDVSMDVQAEEQTVEVAKPLPRPAKKATSEVWKAYAIARGGDPAVVASSTIAELTEAYG